MRDVAVVCVSLMCVLLLLCVYIVNARAVAVVCVCIVNVCAAVCVLLNRVLLCVYF